MATEAKPFASLSSGLLARKGAARPAMRPQGFNQVGNGLEDLGWNDMGFETPKPAVVVRDIAETLGDEIVEHPRAHALGLTPIQSPVHNQQAEIVERLGAVDESEEDEIDETAELYGPEEGLEAHAPEVPLEHHEPEAMFEHHEPEVVAVEIQPEVAAAPVTRAAPAPARRGAPRARSAPGSKNKAAFTLRLDRERHLKLRLACAVDGRSAQQLVTDALDHMLERMPELDGLAAKAKRRG